MFLTAKHMLVSLTAVFGLISPVAKGNFFSVMRIAEPQNNAYFEGTTPNVAALMEFFADISYFAFELTFWENFMANMQVNTDNFESNCILQIDEYVELYRDIYQETRTNIFYVDGVNRKGAGTPTDYGFWLDVITQYADLVVEMANLYEICSLDYIMQAFAPIFTSLSGFLEFCTSSITVIFEEESEAMFLGLS